MTSAGIGSLCHQGDGNNIQTPTAGTGAIISAPGVTSVITELLMSVLYRIGTSLENVITRERLAVCPQILSRKILLLPLY